MDSNKPVDQPVPPSVFSPPPVAPPPITPPLPSQPPIETPANQAKPKSSINFLSNKKFLLPVLGIFLLLGLTLTVFKLSKIGKLGEMFPTGQYTSPLPIVSPSPLPSLSPSPGACPTDVTPYVQGTGSLPGGYATCNNSNHKCLTLSGVPAGCYYLAEVYTDRPQDCGNQEAHLRSRSSITNGGSVCFPGLPVDGDCKVQIDIRYDQGGAPAGNIKTYKLDCGGEQHSPNPSPSQSPPPNQSLTCNNISRDPTTTLNLDDQVIFTCTGTATNTTINHYEFEVCQKPPESIWACISLSDSNKDGNSDAYTIPAYGDYKVQCRVCSRDDSNHCTNWGEAGGWTP